MPTAVVWKPPASAADPALGSHYTTLNCNCKPHPILTVPAVSFLVPLCNGIAKDTKDQEGETDAKDEAKNADGLPF